LVTNVVLHALSTIILFQLLLRMTGAIGASAFVAAVFAVHPLHVESVAWASERKDALSGLFWMLTLLAYSYYVDQPQRRSRYGWVLLCMTLGLLAKPMLVTLPFVLLLLDFWPLRRFDRAAVKEKIPMFALVVVSSFVTLQVQGATGAMSFGLGVPLWARVFNGLHSYTVYLSKSFWPANLAAFYPFSVESLQVARAVQSAALLGAMTGVIFLLRRSRPHAIMGWLWFLGTLVPVIGIVQVGAQAHADRYMYIPLLGIAIAIAYGVRELSARSRFATELAAVVAIGIVVALSVAARMQVHTWKNSFTLFERALVVSPGAAFPHVRLGMIHAMSVDFEKSRQHFDRAFEREPGQVSVVVKQLGSMAAAHAAMGRFPEAVRTSEFALRVAEEAQEIEHSQAIRARLPQSRAGQRSPTVDRR
jgi:hypothetical protein